MGYPLMAHQHPACVIPFGEANEVADKAYYRDVSYVPDCKLRLHVDLA